MKKSILAIILFALFTQTAFADVVYDESVDGDLSSDNLNPTVINLSEGSNEIFGSTTNAPLDRDFWTISIGPGQVLEQVVLQLYDTTEDQSFFAVEAGPTVSDLNGSGLLGASLIGNEIGSQQGDDVLDDLGDASLAGTGFTPPLGPGTYTFWFQETAADTNYGFNFVVGVPEPGTFSGLLGIALVGLTRRRK